MPVFCTVYGGFNQFSQETNKRFYKVSMSVVHIGGKCKKQTEERWKKLQPNFVCGQEEQSLIIPV